MTHSGADIAVFDSGLGGLSVAGAIRALGHAGPLTYLADHAGFPYGAWPAEALASRVAACAAALVEARGEPGAFVVACNTASTLALDVLRARFSFPIVGTVPAIKPAAAATRSGLVSVLATPGTVARDYTKDLVARFAGSAQVTLVGAPRLASLAEGVLNGVPLDVDAARAELAPAFVTDAHGARTDVIVLACTHYPLIADHLAALAPWPVEWIDPAPAIARRARDVAGGAWSTTAAPGVMVSTAPPLLSAALETRLAGLDLHLEATPLHVADAARTQAS